jgi:hypothetical protein
VRKLRNQRLLPRKQPSRRIERRRRCWERDPRWKAVSHSP